MNFFRLRVINTLLLFAAGILLGFLFRERFSSRPPAPASAYQPSPAAPAAATSPAPARKYPPEEDYPEDEPDEDDEPADGFPADREPPRPAVSISQEPAPVIMPSPAPVIEPSRSLPVLKGPQEDAFFSDPPAFTGREVELRLQMITAKKSASGWRLNLVYTSPAKRMEYLYVDDAGVLAGDPDLRIGYVYRVRFVCAGGSASSGNRLVSIEGTGDKAAWATGLSAVE